MRNLMRRGRRLFGAAGWILPVILLVLPACALDPYGTEPPVPAFLPGEEPLTGAIMCDIPAELMPETGYPCATDEQIKAGTADSEAAVRLLTSAGNDQFLDYSKDAIAQCGPGRPRLIKLRAAYPTGTPVCLNCGQLPGVYTNADAACKAKCQDLFDWEGDDGRGPATCEGFAKASPNWVFTCQNGLCSTGGSPNTPFQDPRQVLEPLNWTDANGVTVSADGASIYFDGTGATYPPDANGYRAGAAAYQIIPEWDAMVEFSVSETNVPHVLSLNTTTCLDSKACPDVDPTTADMSVLIKFDSDGYIYVLTETGTQLGKSSDPYVAGERYRLRLSDQHDGEAQLSLWRVVPGGGETFVWSDSNKDHTVTFPLRLEASFRDANAGITDVRLIRVLKK